MVARLNRLATQRVRLPLPCAQARLLSTIEDQGAARISDLAALDHCSQPTMTTQVRRLEDAGLVSRTVDPDDARAVLIRITPKGVAMLRPGPRRPRRGHRPAIWSGSTTPTARRSTTPSACMRSLLDGRAAPDTHEVNNRKGVAAPMWRQPKAVWAVAFASVVAFMGIGLVDPILKPIADNLNASPSQVSLLFTSYMAVMGVAMLITGVVSSRIGPKRTLLLGLVIIIAGAGLAGMSDTVLGIVGWRALWGLGNALFIATALATIVNSARGSVAQAIILYEAALGLGIAVGPLVGGVLGSISWRGPFFGVSALMAVALVVTAFLLPDDAARRTRHHARRPVPRAAAPRPARRRNHRAAVQLRLLHPAGVHAVPARHERPPDRADLLRLGPGAGVHLGGRRAAAAAPVRHRARADRQPAGVDGDAGRDGASAPTTRPCWPRAWWSPGCSSASTTR